MTPRLLRPLLIAAACCTLTPCVMLAEPAMAADDEAESMARRSLQCVPYAREQSGIAIYGDAHSWWQQAAGHYARGQTPQVGAVMALRPHGAMRLGHVATVSAIVDSRTVLLNHANWSPINGERGQIERDVRAIDVSPDNDWSMVRIWYAPIGDLGTTEYPLYGFIYPYAPDAQPARHWTAARAETPQPIAPEPPQERADPIGDLIDELGI